MSHRIELPPELLPLIEKREQADRRQAEGQQTADPSLAATDDAQQPNDRRQGPRRADELGAP